MREAQGEAEPEKQAPRMLGDDSLHQVELREKAKQEMNKEYRQHLVRRRNCVTLCAP